MNRKYATVLYILVVLLGMLDSSSVGKLIYNKITNNQFWGEYYLENELYDTQLEKNVTVIGPGFEKIYYEFLSDNAPIIEYTDFSEMDKEISEVDYGVVTLLTYYFLPDGKKVNYFEIDSSDENSISEALKHALTIESDVVLLDFETKYTEKLENDIKNLENQNIIVISPAGDEGLEKLNFPASDENVISIGAFDINEKLWKNNNFSEKNLYFPGVNVNNARGSNASTTRLASSAAVWYITEMIQYDENTTKEEIIENIIKINSKEKNFKDFFIEKIENIE